jgi:hypothetical protein
MLDPAELVNIVGMPVRHLAQEDIGRQLGVGRTMVNVWRARFKGTPDPFPEPDVETGLGDHPLPGWLPERMDDIRAWLSRHPRLGGHRKGEPA